MIDLFVLDIDGCISHPFESPDWAAVSEIRKLNLRSRRERDIPGLTLCTGRPFPYAEAVAQWLDIRLPFVFESAGLYLPDTARILSRYSSDRAAGKPGIDADSAENSDPASEGSGAAGNGRSLQPVIKFRRWLTDHLLPDYPNVMLEFSKMFDDGVVSPDREQIDRIYKQILEHARNHYPDLEVHRTDVSVNTLLAGNNKGAGFELLSRELDVPLAHMAYIGDSEGDIMPLKRVKMPFAPSNAIEPVRDIAEVLPGETSQAVLEAYRRIIGRNERNRSVTDPENRE